jgi:hypothetical protein
LNRAHAFVGKQAKLSWAYVRLAVLTTACTGLAPVVSAQDAEIIGPLIEGVRCSSPGAKEDLGLNIKKLGKTDDVIGAALNSVAADQARCEPIRAAAAELAAPYMAFAPPTEGELAAEAARQRLAQTLAEADQRVGTLRFETGPPPRNMTRARTTAPAFGQ